MLSSRPNLTAVSLPGWGNILRYTSACRFLNANNRLETLNLSVNALETYGGTEIADYIAANTPLFELNLSGNKLNDEDVALIAQALWKNSNLRYLYLYSNEFTQAGFEPLEIAVVGGSTFNSVYSCNHTCKIHTSGYGITHKLNGHSRVENRALKVYCQFLRKNRDETNARLDAELGGECTPMIPHVLASIGRFYNTLPDDVGTRYVGPLAIVFELARSWKMSEMYNF